MYRRQRILDLVSPHGRRGIEIGPLTRPFIVPADGAILYADHLSTEGLARKYQKSDNLGPNGVGGLVPIDLVVDESQSLAQALAARGEAPVDYIVASHVMEHVADPIDWLNGCAEALVEDGLLCLVAPDKRFTFDQPRATTRLAEIVAHYLAGASRPSPLQVFDYHAQIVPFGPTEIAAAWEGRPADGPSLRDDAAKATLAIARKVHVTGAYQDVHCTTYTPHSFAELYGAAIRLGLIPFEIARLDPTHEREAEFFVALRKRAAASPTERARANPRLDPRRHDALPRPQLLSGLRRPARALARLLGRGGHEGRPG